MRRFAGGRGGEQPLDTGDPRRPRTGRDSRQELQRLKLRRAACAPMSVNVPHGPIQNSRRGRHSGGGVRPGAAGEPRVRAVPDVGRTFSLRAGGGRENCEPAPTGVASAN